MKNNLLCAVRLSAVFILLAVTQACAQTPAERAGILSLKAISLTSATCNIYPAMSDVPACVDKVVRKILIDRDVNPERTEELIREQAAAAPTKHPPKFRDLLRSKEQLAQRVHVYKLLDIIDAACAVPPAITDFEKCMDAAYHSILTARDPHSAYFNEAELLEFRRQMSGNLQGIGIEIGLAGDKSIGVVRVMEGSPAEKSGIQDGDRIVTIINGDVREPVSSFPHIGEAIKKVKGEPNTSVTLEILRGEADQKLTLTVVRAAIAVPHVKSEILSLPNDPKTQFAYIRLTQFGSTLRQQMVDAVKGVLKTNPNLKGFIFDVRGNPGGDLGQAHEASDALVNSPEPLISIRDNLGVHAYGTASDERMPEPQPGDITNGLPIAVLINGRSASASEIFAGILQELERSVTMGEPSWQKGSVQRVTPLSDRTATKTTEAEYLIGSPAKWVAVQCFGVTPDIPYVSEGTISPAVTKNDCDFDGSITSGGASSHPGRVRAPLAERNPALYAMGLQMLEAVKVLDHKTFVRFERIKKMLKIKDPVKSQTPEE